MTFRPSRDLNIAIVLMVVRWAVLSAEPVVMRIEVPTNAVVTITVSAAAQVTVATNIVLAVPDARRSLPRAIPTPPMPFSPNSMRDVAAGAYRGTNPPMNMVARDVVEVPMVLRPLRGSTNDSSYAHYLRRLAEASSNGRRRSQ